MQRERESLAYGAARPSGTKNIDKTYAGSFPGADHQDHIVKEALAIVNDTEVAKPDRRPVKGDQE